MLSSHSGRNPSQTILEKTNSAQPCAQLSRATQGLQHLLSHSDIGPGLPKPDPQHFFEPGVLDIPLSGQIIRLLPPDSSSTPALTLLPRQSSNSNRVTKKVKSPLSGTFLENNRVESTLWAPLPPEFRGGTGSAALAASPARLPLNPCRAAGRELQRTMLSSERTQQLPSLHLLFCGLLQTSGKAP